MNGVLNDMELLKSTNQHLVFENDVERANMANLIKSLFNLTTTGIMRIHYLADRKYDRELLGHLVSMQAQGNHSLQEEVKRLKSEMFCMFLKNKELEEETKSLDEEGTSLRGENARLKEENETMKNTLEICGINAAMKNCSVLKQAMKLINEEAAFDKLEAAVACFSSEPTTSTNHNHSAFCFELKDHWSETQNEQSESPTSCTFESTISSKRPRVEHSPQDLLPPPFLTNIPEVQLYHNILAQQQLRRQDFLEKSASAE